MMAFDPNTINGLVAWIDSETGVNGNTGGAIDGVTNQAGSVPTPPPPPPPPSGSVPTNPIAFTKGTPFTLSSGAGNYWVYVPSSYDSTHQTPTTLFIWMHGCGGVAQWDLNMVAPTGTQNYIAVSLGGKDNNCWDPNTDMTLVMAALANMKTHFNIAPTKVVLGGYSSGGDLGYRTIFYNASSFAGMLAINTAPFRDTGSSQSASLAAASWKFNVYHVAHLQDTTYPIATVRAETQAMIAAGFPVTRLEVDGTHYDNAGATVNGHTVPGTAADTTNFLCPQLANGWTVGVSGTPTPVPVPVPTPVPAPTPGVGFTAALRTGTNVAGYESATYDQYPVSTGPSIYSYPAYTTTQQDWLRTSGAGCVRLMFSWEGFQSSLGGPVPAASSGNFKAYFDAYVNTVKSFLSKGFAVMCEPWGFNANIKDTDICYRGGTFTPAQFADFWSKFSAAVNATTGSDQRVCFGLMNEPHTASNGPAGSIGITLTTWYACAQAAITAIRGAGVTNTIAVGGMNYADSAQFVSNGSAAQHLTLVDPLHNTIVSVHNYDALNKSTTTALRDATSALVNWARANGVKVHISEVAIDAGAPKSSLAIATAQWADWTAYVNANSDVILGWCWWATGAKGWWDNADSSSGYHWGLAQSGTDSTPSVYMNLIKSSLVGNNVTTPTAHLAVTMKAAALAATTPNNFASTSPNRPVWRTSASGANFGFANGKHSISFEGTPDYLVANTPIVLPNGCSYWAVVKFNSTDISVTNSKNAPMTLFGDSNPTTSKSQFGFSAGVMKLRYKVGSTWVSYNSRRGIYNDGKMHCIACTHDLAGNVKFYVDGVLTDSFVGVTYNPTTTFNILGAGQNKVDPFLGQIAEAMVFNKALTAADVANLKARASALWVA